MSLTLSAIVGIFDGTPDHAGHIIDIKGVVINLKVPIYWDGIKSVSNLVGEASLSIGGRPTDLIPSVIFAQMHFPNHSPAKWPIPSVPTLLAMQTPKLAGVIHSRAMRYITHCEFTHIDLSPANNMDPRIMSLGHATVLKVPGRYDDKGPETCVHEPVLMIFSSFCKKCNKTL